MRLVYPSTKYQSSYFKAVRGMIKEGKTFNDSYSLKDLKSQIKSWTELRNKNISFRFWLIDNSKYIGTIRLRRKITGPYRGMGSHVHYSISPLERKKGYGTKILKLGLQKAKNLGFNKLYITCLSDNLGSKKVIESNGAKFVRQATLKGEEGFITILKYSINLNLSK